MRDDSEGESLHNLLSLLYGELEEVNQEISNSSEVQIQPLEVKKILGRSEEDVREEIHKIYSFFKQIKQQPDSDVYANCSETIEWWINKIELELPEDD
jgi:hypothetical protein